MLRFAAREGLTVAARIALPYAKADDPAAFASIHSNPPGVLTDYAGLVFANYGKGRVIYSAAPTEADQRMQYRDMMRRILEMGVPASEWSFCANARRQVELFGYETEKGYSIAFVDLLFDDERIPTEPFTITLRLQEGEAVESVKLLPSGEALPFEVQNGILSFQTPKTELFAMLEVALK